MPLVGGVFLCDPLLNLLIKDHLELLVTVDKCRRISMDDLFLADLIIFVGVDLLQVDAFGFHYFFGVMIVVVGLFFCSLVMINLLNDLDYNCFVVSIGVFTLLICG